MKYIIILFCFFAFANPLKAYTLQDSLLKSIDTYKKQDTNRVNLLVDYCIAQIFTADKKVLKFANEAYQLSKKLNFKNGEIASLNCLGNYYYQQAIYDKAIVYYTQALRLAEKENNLKNIVIGKSNLASLYTRIGQQQKALQEFKEADSILMKMGAGLSQNRAAILTNMGAAYSSLGDHEQAVTYHKKVLNICEKLNISFGIVLARGNIGEELNYIGKYKEALTYLIPAVEMAKENGFSKLLGGSYKSIGQAYLKLNQPQNAIKYLKDALQIAKQDNDQNALLKINKNLLEVYEKQGDFKNAYQATLAYMAVNDSIYGKEKQQILAEVSTKYETEKKEATIRSLNQKQKIAELESAKKNIYIYSIIGAFVGIAIMAYFLFSRYKIKQKNELLKAQLAEAEKLLMAEKKVTESELKALKSQMNPHFIFNALNSIQEQFMYGDKLKANEQLSNFTYLTRQILEVSGKKSISLSTEVEILTKYLELEKMRFQQDFTYQISVAAHIDDDYLKIPPMLIQPLIENSIKHGLMHKNGEKYLEVIFSLTDDEAFLICSVTDNGIGRSASAKINATQQKHLSFSTDAISQRLQLLNPAVTLDEVFKYIDLKDEKGDAIGTKLEMKIPITFIA
jgi:tetratricopeptide (TPR) repeat protein